MSVASEMPRARDWTSGPARWLRGIVESPLLRRSGLAVIDQAVVSGTSFATSVLLARWSSREELGVYYLALSVVYFARGVQEQLVSAPYMIYCGRKRTDELPMYAGSALVHMAVLLTVMVGVISLGLLTGFASAGAEQALVLLLAAAPLMLVREFARQMSFAHLDLARATALDVAATLLQFSLLAGLLIAGQLTVSTTLAAIAISSGVATIGWLATSRQRMTARVAATVRDWWHNWSFARWALASHLLACTTPYVMPWVVAVSHGEAETGLLGACTTLVGLSNTFLNGLCNFLSPQAAQAYARGGVDELRAVLLKTMLLFGVTLGALAGVAFLCGEALAALVYGPQFAGAGAIISVLSLSVLANSVGVTAGNGLWAMERPSANFVADLFSFGVVIVAAVALVPVYGPLGAAMATLAGTASDAAVRVVILLQTMREIAGQEATT
jgi:O-antigen/teichoic acid export membrane protein